MNHSQFQYADSAPYPSTDVKEMNHNYAQAMLVNIGSCNSEMTAISLYYYNSIVLQSTYSEISQCFSHINMVEMHHLHILGELAHKLGAEPRFWSRVGRQHIYWTPGCNQYPLQISVMLKNAIHGETGAIAQYKQQTQWIQDECVIKNLNRIIADEEIHLSILHQLCKELGVPL